MPSKEHSHSDEKSRPEQRPAQHEAEGLETVGGLNHPATMVRPAGQAPGSLAARDLLRLQRTVGNRAVQQVLAQRRPAEEELPVEGAEQQAGRGEVAQALRRHPGADESTLFRRLEGPESMVLQRHCWTMGEEEKASFAERNVEDLVHPFGGPGGESEGATGAGQYFRLQPDDKDSPSKYYGLWTPKYDQVAEDGKVDQGERKVLAVKRDWVKQWKYLVKYGGGRAGYQGGAKEQKDEDGTYYQGGAPQVVFPKEGKPKKVDAYPVEE